MPNRSLAEVMAFMAGENVPPFNGAPFTVNPGYPTQAEIMERPPTHKPEVIAFFKQWKRSTWKEARAAGTEGARYSALTILVQGIAEIYRRPVEVGINTELASACYVPMQNKIVFNSRLSVITALHELSHHLFGTSEKKACRWSVHLFKKVFPRAFAQLEWQGHMLVKRRANLIEQPCPNLNSDEGSPSLENSTPTAAGASL